MKIDVIKIYIKIFINLEKFSSLDFYYKRMKRIYNIIFVADVTK